MADIEITDPGGKRSRLTLQEGRRYVLGRSPRADVTLSDPTLSRRHAEIYHADGAWMLKDLGSVNGVLVEGRRVDQPVRLAERLGVRVGDCALRYLPEGRPAAPPVSLADVDPSPAVRIGLEDSGLDAWRPTEPGERAEARAIRRRFAVIERASLELSAHEPLEVLLPKALDLVFDAVDPDRAALLLREPDGGLACRAFRGPAGQEVRLPRAVARTVIEERASLLTADAQADVRLERSDSIGGQGIRSAMAVPLWNNREVIGLLYADSLGGPGRFTEDDLRLLTMLANVAAIQIENHRLFEEHLNAQRIEQEALAAGEIQQGLLPAAPPAVPGYRLAGWNAPCHEVGGDYFDFLRLDERRVVAVIADVAGKGMGAALVMAVLQATLHAAAEDAPDLLPLVERVNRAIARSAPANRFVTAFVMELDHGAHRARCINAGHSPSPLWVTAAGQVRPLGPGGPPLGPRPGFRYRVEDLVLGPGDLIFACTDGVTEATDPGGRVLGEERLTGLLVASRPLPPEAIHDRLREALRGHQGAVRTADDLTLVTVRRDS
jgi:serine phosphatase RsbU (regulator of sigma subunit)